MALVEYEVLLKLAINAGRMRMSALADVAFLSRSGLTRIVDELESLNWSPESPTRSDGRVWVRHSLRLAAAGFTTARRTPSTNVRQLFFRHLSAEQQRGLAGCWEQILSGLEQDVSPTPGGPRRGRRPAASDARPAP